MKAVNLLPDDNRGPAPVSSPAKPVTGGGSPFGAYLVLGFLALAIVMVASYVLVGNSIKDRRAELASVQAESQSVRAQADALKPYADFRQLAVQRVETVSQLAKSRFNWERALRDVSRAMPADVHLKSFKGSVSGATPTGGTPPAGAPVAPNIVLAGCTSSQPAVAKLMARLRGVRGVTRVSLTKSEKPVSTNTPVAPVTATGQTPLCGRGSSKPDFELTMYFERAAKAPVATPSTAPPATGAQPAAGAQPASAGDATATPTPAPATGSTSSQGVTTP